MQTLVLTSRCINRLNDRKDIYSSDKQDKYTESPNLLGFQNSCLSRIFLDIFACTVNHLIQSRIDVYTTKWILKVFPELSGLWDATMTVLFYWFSLRTFTFGLAPCQCFGLHGVLLGTQKRGWTWVTLCSPLACQEGLQRGQFLAWQSAAWLGTTKIGVSINTEF